MASDPGSGPPWSKRGFLFAAAGVLLLVVLLVIVLITTSGSNDDPTISGVPTAPPNSPTTGSATPSNADQGPTTVPTSTPEGIRWDLYGANGAGVALPVSEKAGPRQITASTATGFAHTPTGALLAASHIPTRKLIAPQWQEVVEKQIVPGPGRDAFLAARSKVTDESVIPGQLGQLAGFKFVNYADSIATVQLVTRFVSGNLQVVTITVQWSDGDWKEVLQPDGSDSPSAQKVNDLSGYVQWGGV